MIAEFIGTFALVFVGGGAIIVTVALGTGGGTGAGAGGGGLLAVALAHGLILGVMVSATMHISGGQINPAVSTALGIIGKQSWGQAALFIVAQLLGAVAAAFLLDVLFASLETPDGAASAVETARLGATLGGMGLGAGAVFGLEVIATFFLMFVIMGTAVDDRGVGKTAAVGGLAIGLTVSADILCFGPLTGASMNPARSFGPALVASAWEMHWVYWAAPIVGAALAALVYHGVFGSGTDE